MGLAECRSPISKGLHMISYLKGTVVGLQKQSATRVILTLEVDRIGYELQIVPRLVQHLPPRGEILQVFTEMQLRDDRLILYGFETMAQRDLFRQLVSVSGIGAQLAIALLDTLALPDLVQAIVSGNTHLLCATPGVGKKTAERIALELRAKLSEWRSAQAWETSPILSLDIRDDVEMTLLALGYTAEEVVQALGAIVLDANLAASPNAEDWIKRAIAWLSQAQ
jgi:holliday junction DNA helicase RuvA